MGVKVRKYKGAWWLFIDHQGRRRAKRVGVGKTGKKSADQAAIQIQAKLAEGDASVLSPKPSRPEPSTTFAMLADEWLEKYPAVHAVAASTMENYRSFTRQHLVPFFGAISVPAITADTIEDFIAAKRAPGGSVRFTGKSLSDGSLRTGLLALRLTNPPACRPREAHRRQPGQGGGVAGDAAHRSGGSLQRPRAPPDPHDGGPARLRLRHDASGVGAVRHAGRRGLRPVLERPGPRAWCRPRAADVEPAAPRANEDPPDAAGLVPPPCAGRHSRMAPRGHRGRQAGSRGAP